ncbi:MAG: Uma2 family endonuclease [Acidobacteriaceae bacterium]|nr:Uma2 family endonuclease [Acidobacteriaceae bacterium]
MATAAKLTIAEFEQQYGEEKPYYEYWYGEPVQKSMANFTHGLLQGILMVLLSKVGYKAASEVTLKIDRDFQPIPDVIASRAPVERPYPTRAVDIVIEILSEDDRMARILTKCRAYEGWGFEQIYVVDPNARLIFRWIDRGLEEVNAVDKIAAEQIWSELDQAFQ